MHRLDALCMFRDIVVSPGPPRHAEQVPNCLRLIIFLALCPLVLLSGISEFICLDLKDLKDLQEPYKKS